MQKHWNSTLFSWLAVAILAGALAVFYFTKPLESAMAADKDLPANVETIVVGMGCFWGAEKRMAGLHGIGYFLAFFSPMRYASAKGFETKAPIKY